MTMGGTQVHSLTPTPRKHFGPLKGVRGWGWVGLVWGVHFLWAPRRFEVVFLQFFCAKLSFEEGMHLKINFFCLFLLM